VPDGVAEAESEAVVEPVGVGVGVGLGVAAPVGAPEPLVEGVPLCVGVFDGDAPSGSVTVALGVPVGDADAVVDAL